MIFATTQLVYVYPLGLGGTARRVKYLYFLPTTVGFRKQLRLHSIRMDDYPSYVSLKDGSGTDPYFTVCVYGYGGCPRHLEIINSVHKSNAKKARLR